MLYERGNPNFMCAFFLLPIIQRGFIAKVDSLVMVLSDQNGNICLSHTLADQAMDNDGFNTSGGTADFVDL